MVFYLEFFAIFRGNEIFFIDKTFFIVRSFFSDIKESVSSRIYQSRILLNTSLKTQDVVLTSFQRHLTVMDVR